QKHLDIQPRQENDRARKELDLNIKGKGTMKRILLLATAAFFCTQILHADVIYRETFRTMTNNATLNLVGWQGFFGPTATGNPVGSQLGLSSSVGKPPLLANVN